MNGIKKKEARIVTASLDLNIGVYAMSIVYH